MSSWSTIRKATDEDRERLDAAGRRFIEKHGDRYSLNMLFMWNTYEDDRSGLQSPYGLACDRAADNGDPDHPRLRRIWRKAMRRALRCNYADGIAYGYVGSHVE